MTNKNNKNINRRDAIKLLGAAAGASALANLPAKWSKPELAGGALPAHAQTSGCPAGSSTLLVEVLAFSSGIIVGSGFSCGAIPNIFVDSVDFPKAGTSTFLDCNSECIYFGFNVTGGTTATIRFTLNGTVLDTFDLAVSGTPNVFITVDGATGVHGFNEVVCTLPI